MNLILSLLLWCCLERHASPSTTTTTTTTTIPPCIDEWHPEIGNGCLKVPA